MSDTGNDNRQTAEVPLSDELYELCSSDSLSIEGLRESIERHGLTPNENNDSHVSDYDFFLETCNNERVNEGLIQCLLEYFPAAAMASDDDENDSKLPLHYICCNKNVTLSIVQLLIDAAPDSLRHADNHSHMPLHYLCKNSKVRERAALQILTLLIEKCPEAVRHADNYGCLPVHIAAYGGKSPEFCRVLIEAYPESERVATHMGSLPLHLACRSNTVATVEYFYNFYPDAINHATARGTYPIHDAIIGLRERCDPESAIEIVKFLLKCNSNVALQKNSKGRPLLLWACRINYDNSNLDADTAVELIKVICDASPESVRNDDNNNGRLPIHGLCKAKNGDETVALGILKFLIHRYPESIRHADNEGILPVHLACRQKSPEFCRVLIEAYPGSERIADHRGKLPFHWACSNNTLATVDYLNKLYPDAVNHAATNSVYLAIFCVK